MCLKCDVTQLCVMWVSCVLDEGRRLRGARLFLHWLKRSLWILPITPAPRQSHLASHPTCIP